MKTRIVELTKPKTSKVANTVPSTHYLVRRYCSNCAGKIKLTIPQGITVEDFIQNLNCPHCGCSCYEYFMVM